MIDPNAIEFTTRELTVGEILLLKRIEANVQDLEAIVGLIVSRSNADLQTVCALPVSALEPLAIRMRDTLAVAVSVSPFDKVLRDALEKRPDEEARRG